MPQTSKRPSNLATEAAAGVSAAGRLRLVDRPEQAGRVAVFSDRFRAHHIEQQRGELTVALNVAPLQPKPARQQRTTPAQGDGAHLQQHLVEQSRVGKGTVYLHWPTKEAIFVDLILRSIEAVLTQLVNDITHDPAAARPQNLITSLITYALQEPVVRTLQDGDEELLHTIARARRIAPHGANAADPAITIPLCTEPSGTAPICRRR